MDLSWGEPSEFLPLVPCKLCPDRFAQLPDWICPSCAYRIDKLLEEIPGAAGGF